MLWWVIFLFVAALVFAAVVIHSRLDDANSDY